MDEGLIEFLSFILYYIVLYYATIVMVSDMSLTTTIFTLF